MPSAIRLFKVFGITVYLHWSWFLVAVIELRSRQGNYTSPAWNVAEYLSLFAIVLLHEFGHALACRSVGGKAERIMLWPLGGVAYVSPPPRPGALLWSIAAGPLVNVMLVPVTLLLAMIQLPHDPHYFFWSVAYVNMVLLAFNILPIYPLDGGQMLQAVLWFIMGRARSLMVAAVIGIVGAAGLGLFALWDQNVWLIAIALFAGFQAFNGIRMARLLRERETMPRRAGFACPSCGASPPMGMFWTCSNCGTQFDTFETGGVCPRCGRVFAVTSCADCGKASPIAQWQGAPVGFPVITTAQPVPPPA